MCLVGYTSEISTGTKPGCLVGYGIWSVVLGYGTWLFWSYSCKHPVTSRVSTAQPCNSATVYRCPPRPGRWRSLCDVTWRLPQDVPTDAFSLSLGVCVRFLPTKGAWVAHGAGCACASFCQ